MNNSINLSNNNNKSINHSNNHWNNQSINQTNLSGAMRGLQQQIQRSSRSQLLQLRWHLLVRLMPSWMRTVRQSMQWRILSSRYLRDSMHAVLWEAGPTQSKQIQSHLTITQTHSNLTQSDQSINKQSQEQQDEQDEQEQPQKEELYHLVLLDCYVYCLLILGFKLYLNVILSCGVFGLDFTGICLMFLGFLFWAFIILSFSGPKSCIGL